MTYDGVMSPGANDVEVYGVDSQGNSGAAASPGPAPTERAQAPVIARLEPGRAILFGHSFSVLDNDDPPVEPLILAKAVQSTVVAAKRTPRVVGFRSANVDPTACTNALQGIAAALGGSGTCTDRAFPWYSEFSDPTQLAAQLLGKDVLLIYDLRDSDLSANLSSMWHDALVTYLDEGGVVIILDGGTSTEESGIPSDGTYRIFANGGRTKTPILEIDSVSTDNMVNNPQIYQADDPLVPTDDDGDVITSYSRAAGSIDAEGIATFESSDPYAVAVYAPHRNGFYCNGQNARKVASRVSGAPIKGMRQIDGLCPADVTVFEKPFPYPVAVTVGVPLESENIGDTSAMVVYMDVNGTQTLVHADVGGNAVLDMPGGGTVIAAGNPSEDQTALTTFLGVKPLDVLSAFPARDVSTPSFGSLTVGATDVPDGDSMACDVGVPSSSGITTLQNAADTDFDFNITALDGDGTLANGFIDGLCTELDDSSNPLAYYTFSGVTAPGNGEQTSVDLPDVDTFTALTPFTLTLGEPASQPPTPLVNGGAPDSYQGQVQLTDELLVGHQGLDIVERQDVFQSQFSSSTGGRAFTLPPSYPSSLHYVPAGFADTSLEMLQIQYQLQVIQGNDGVIGQTFATTRNRVAPLDPGDAGLVLHPDTELLPLINDATLDVSQLPALTVTLNAAHPIVADGSVVELQWGPFAHAWIIVSPAGTSITVPALNADLAKTLAGYLPASAADVESYEVNGLVRASSDLGSYDAFRNGYPYSFDQLPAIGEEVGASDKTLFFNGEHIGN